MHSKITKRGFSNFNAGEFSCELKDINWKKRSTNINSAIFFKNTATFIGQTRTFKNFNKKEITFTNLPWVTLQVAQNFFKKSPAYSLTDITSSYNK